jgi:hypothetical protein
MPHTGKRHTKVPAILLVGLGFRLLAVLILSCFGKSYYWYISIEGTIHPTRPSVPQSKGRDRGEYDTAPTFTYAERLKSLTEEKRR